MSPEALDRVLAEWDERLGRIDASLLALEAEPTYQMLAPRAATRAPLEGLSARVVGPALDALSELFEHRGRLSEVLERARGVRESMPALFGRDEKERELAALLDGPSIELPPETTPLARRTLLDPGGRDVRVTPAQLLEAMSAAFDRARDAVFAVKDAWERSERELGAIDGQIQAARRAAAEVGLDVAVSPELDAASRELTSARVRVAQDPLGALDALGSGLAPRVASLSSHLSAVAAERDRVQGALGEARQQLAGLNARHRLARAAAERLPAELEGAVPPGPPVDDAAIADLGGWLGRIERTAAEGRWSSAGVGLTAWSNACGAACRQDDALTGALEAIVARRDELAGRLRARRAQAAALAARGAVLPAGAEDLATDAERLLSRRPTPLAKATELVARFDEAVRRARKP